MSHMDNDEKAWTKKYLRSMSGLRVGQVGVSVDGFPFFYLLDGEGEVKYTIEVSRDQEGNGPGFLFGLPGIR